MNKAGHVFHPQEDNSLVQSSYKGYILYLLLEIITFFKNLRLHYLLSLLLLFIFIIGYFVISSHCSLFSFTSQFTLAHSAN